MHPSSQQVRISGSASLLGYGKQAVFGISQLGQLNAFALAHYRSAQHFPAATLDLSLHAASMSLTWMLKPVRFGCPDPPPCIAMIASPKLISLQKGDSEFTFMPITSL